MLSPEAVAEADAATLHVGSRKVDVAIHWWYAARSSGSWAGYPQQIIRAEYPEWAAKRWAEREEMDPLLAGIAYDIGQSPHRPLDWEDAA